MTAPTAKQASAVAGALREACRQQNAVDTLSGFVRYVWSEAHFKPLTWSWYLDLLCRELEGLVAGVAPDGQPVKELWVNLPPGHLKSWLCSVFFPAWVWLNDPTTFLLTLANEGDLATRDSRRSRGVILSESYHTLQVRRALARGEARWVGDDFVATGDGDGGGEEGKLWKAWTLAPDQRQKVNFETPFGGGRDARGIMALTTGRRCDGLIVDDPHDVREVLLGDPARVAERMRDVNAIYGGALLSRLNHGAWRLGVMQRLHPADLCGVRVGPLTGPGAVRGPSPRPGVRVVCLAARFDPSHPLVHPEDPRAPGELLCPEMHDEEKDAEMRGIESLGPKGAAAQLDQFPTVEIGGRFKRGWFTRHYDGDPVELARRAKFDLVGASVDCSFRSHADADFVVAQVWGVRWASAQALTEGGLPRDGIRPGKYLLDQVRDRMGLLGTCATLRNLRAKWPWMTLVLVEGRANGDAVIETLRAEGHTGVVCYDPDRSKAARAEVSAVAFESGEVYLPRPERAPWLADYVEEHVQFPAGLHDDQVDATSQWMIRCAGDAAGSGGDFNDEFGWVAELGR